ncbi:hypothetical protein, partial [Vibrio proteolyticus]
FFPVILVFEQTKPGCLKSLRLCHLFQTLAEMLGSFCWWVSPLPVMNVTPESLSRVSSWNPSKTPVVKVELDCVSMIIFSLLAPILERALLA